MDYVHGGIIMMDCVYGSIILGRKLALLIPFYFRAK